MNESHNKVTQKAVSAGGDVIGRDKNVYEIRSPSRGIEALLIKLKEQIETNQHIHELVEELARYHTHKSIDGINGLEDKLRAANMYESTYLDAIDKKERFSKLLETMSLYSSAQKIFAVFLAKVENEFNYAIYPQIPTLSEAELNIQIIERIVKPICDEVDCDILLIDYNVVFGMVYWLAEQCYIRWHS